MSGNFDQTGKVREKRILPKILGKSVIQTIFAKKYWKKLTIAREIRQSQKSGNGKVKYIE